MRVVRNQPARWWMSYLYGSRPQQPSRSRTGRICSVGPDSSRDEALLGLLGLICVEFAVISGALQPAWYRYFCAFATVFWLGRLLGTLILLPRLEPADNLD